MAHRMRGARDEDFDDVEAAVSVFEPVLLHIEKRRAENALLLRAPHRLRRHAEARRAARLDLDEEQGAAVFGDDIDLAHLRSELTRHDAAAAPFQVSRRRFLSLIAEALLRHFGISGF